MSRARDKYRLASAALLFAALGDSTRLTLLKRLNERGPASISSLADSFPAMTRQGVTKHLNVLADAGIISGNRQGRECVWTVESERLAEARRYLEVVERGWTDALARLKKHIEDNSV